jgi:ferric-dicitrate binding protein FerR (iron transport regulator)
MKLQLSVFPAVYLSIVTGSSVHISSRLLSLWNLRIAHNLPVVNRCTKILRLCATIDSAQASCRQRRERRAGSGAIKRFLGLASFNWLAEEIASQGSQLRQKTGKGLDTTATLRDNSVALILPPD